MNARQLWEWLGDNTSPDQEIQLEVGGDGAIHTGAIDHVNSDPDAGIVTLSTEPRD